MTIFEMMNQSGFLAIIGIAVVFGFLTLMVFCVSSLGKFFQAREAATALASPAAAVLVSQSSAPERPKQFVAAISAALHEYNNSH